MEKLDVAVLGATGAVGQRFIKVLEDHPWFRVAEVVGSDRSAGRPYREAARWVLNGEPPPRVGELTVKPLDADLTSPLVFSALPKEAAESREAALAAAGHIVATNASFHRMDEDVPLLLPEVNADHLALVDLQRRRRGWSGAIVANSNCTAMPIVMSLAPLRPFGIASISIVSMQAISGAGYPGVASLDIIDNLIPYIGGEEDKVETEPLRMLGKLHNDRVEWLPADISASCNRVPVIDGHLVIISVELTAQPTLDEIIDAWRAFRGPNPVPHLPSAPAQPVIYTDAHDRPQPRRDRDAGHGMSTTVGRLRTCPVLGYKFAALSHNTIRGAAGGSILNAELMVAQGFFPGFAPEFAPASGESDRR
ncbi:MAG: aspartate-semialdehyde dehydrogenase [Candidatus Flexifilum sp.]